MMMHAISKVPAARPKVSRALGNRFPLLFACLLVVAFPATAQVQRSFANLSFEQPNLATAGCRVYIAASQVPGWNTTHTPFATQNVGDCVVPAGFSQTAPILELWRTPRDNASGGMVNARSGSQIAELNAEVASRIYQNVCLINGESVSWRFSHRGRGSTSVHDQMEMKVGATSTVVRVGTTNNGSFLTPVVSQGTIQPPTNVAGNVTWVDYRGSFAYAGTTGTTNLGFEAIGGTTSGNLLDDIQIELAPFVEFTQPSSSTPESSSDNRPTLRVNGTVYAAFPVTVQITGGTATLGTDYTTPGNSSTITVTVPAGNYDGASASSLFPLPVTIVNDTEAEGNETILFQITPPGSPAPFLLRSSASCGAAAQTTWTYTIVDDDASITVLKNAAAPVPVSGQPTQFDVLYTIQVSNPTGLSASYALTDTPGMDPDTSIVSAGSVRTGGGSGGGAANLALADSGPWALTTGQRTLPAGQTDTYALTVRIQVNRGGSTGNDACAVPSTPGSGLHNSATATLQSPAGTFISSACQNTPTPVWVTLRKQLTGRAAATDQVQIRLFSGGIPVATATTTGSAIPATATTGVRVLPAGATMQFDEAVKANGTGADQVPSNYGTSLVCTNATAGSPTVLPGGAGTPVGARQQWAEFSPAAGDDLDCLITNTPGAVDLWIRKTNTPAQGMDDLAGDTLLSGAQTTYDIVVGNNGPAAASNVVLRDPVPSGLNNCQLATPACAVTGGTATCPTVGTGAGQLSVANLQSTAGVLVPQLQPNSVIRVRMTCTVN